MVKIRFSRFTAGEPIGDEQMHGNGQLAGFCEIKRLRRGKNKKHAKYFIFDFCLSLKFRKRKTMQENLIKKISKEKIYPIIRSNDAQRAVDTAHALIEGGIKLLEITIENASLYQAINEISKSVTVSAGGVITAQQAIKAIDSGAELLSSPIFQMNMVKISKDKEVPLIACASTANEAYSAWKTRVPLIKIFPAKALGGVLYIEDLLRPMPFLNVMPSGNILLEEVPDYIKAGAAAVGIGRSFYENSSFKEITQKAKKVIKELKDL